MSADFPPRPLRAPLLGLENLPSHLPILLPSVGKGLVGEVGDSGACGDSGDDCAVSTDSTDSADRLCRSRSFHRLFPDPLGVNPAAGAD
eukprot:751340-Prorocentrum_minimum.AAC.1